MIAMAWFGLLASCRSVQAQDEPKPADPVAVFNQAQDLHEKGDLAGAIRLYKKALEINPEFPEAEYQRGIAESALRNDVEAEAAFRRAVKLRPEWSLALGMLGDLLVRKHLEVPAARAAEERPNEAYTILESALRADPNNFRALVALTDLHIYTQASAASLKGTLTKLKAATDGTSNVPTSLWRARAAIEEQLGQMPDARTSLAKALSIEPNDKRALTQAVSLAIIAGDLLRAREVTTRLEHAGTDPGTLLFLKARIEAAEGDLRSAADLLAQIKRPSSAMVEFRDKVGATINTDAAGLEKKLESDQGNVSILSRLCSLYRRDNPAKALEYCRRASEAEPDKIEHAIGFGAALVQAKQYDAAVRLFSKLIEIQPDNATARANLATALFLSKRYVEAKGQYRWIASEQPKLAMTYYFLGVLHDQLEEYLDAMANYQVYLKLADPVRNRDEIDKVKFRLPALQQLISQGKGKKRV
jgi:tetratricopeptide (TPR) repeat protein